MPVSHKKRGGAAARRACRPASFLTVLILLAGCHRQPPAVVPHYVRMEALLSLHPMWASVVALDQAAQQRDKTPSATLKWTATSVPADFTPPTFTPTRSVEAQPVEDYVRRNLLEAASLARERNRRTLAREGRIERRKVERAYAQERARREAALREERGRAAAALDAKIQALQFREAALQVQIRAYSTIGTGNGISADDARRQRALVQTSIADLQSQQKNLLGDVREEVVAGMKPFRDKLDMESAARLAQRAAALEAEAQKLEQAAIRRSAQDMIKLDMASEAIPLIGRSSSAPATVPPMPVAQLAAPDVTGAQARANAGAGNRLTQHLRDQLAQRARLLQDVQADTQRAVEQIARQNGWTLVAEGTSNATDVTAAVASALRAQWQLEPK